MFSGTAKRFPDILDASWQERRQVTAAMMRPE
jgi:hypothetical protein